MFCAFCVELDKKHKTIVESNIMGASSSHNEEYESDKQGRFPVASKDPFVNCALRIEWATCAADGLTYFGGFTIKLWNIESSIDMIITHLAALQRGLRLSIYIDLGKGFVDTDISTRLIESGFLDAGELNGVLVESIKITGKFDANMGDDAVHKWWYNMVALNNFLGLEFVVGAKYQIDPLKIDQIGRIPAMKTDRALLGGLKQQRFPG